MTSNCAEQRRSHRKYLYAPDLSGSVVSQFYLKPMESAFGADVDYAMLVKLDGEPLGNPQERRYSSGQCCGIQLRAHSQITARDARYGG